MPRLLFESTFVLIPFQYIFRNEYDTKTSRFVRDLVSPWQNFCYPSFCLNAHDMVRRRYSFCTIWFKEGILVALGTKLVRTVNLHGTVRTAFFHARFRPWKRLYNSQINTFLKKFALGFRKYHALLCSRKVLSYAPVDTICEEIFKIQTSRAGHWTWNHVNHVHVVCYTRWSQPIKLKIDLFAPNSSQSCRDKMCFAASCDPDEWSCTSFTCRGRCSHWKGDMFSKIFSFSHRKTGKKCVDVHGWVVVLCCDFVVREGCFRSDNDLHFIQQWNRLDSHQSKVREEFCLYWISVTVCRTLFWTIFEYFFRAYCILRVKTIRRDTVRDSADFFEAPNYAQFGHYRSIQLISDYFVRPSYTPTLILSYLSVCVVRWLQSPQKSRTR